MSILKFEDYWNKDTYYPPHEITKLMSLFIFQQISSVAFNIINYKLPEK